MSRSKKRSTIFNLSNLLFKERAMSKGGRAVIDYVCSMHVVSCDGGHHLAGLLDYIGKLNTETIL